MAQSPLHRLSRRQWLQLSTAGVLGGSMSGWFEALAHGAAAVKPQRPRACILLWMNGGASQLDTFDLKPGHANGGPFKEIETSVPGIRISEHLPKISRFMNKMALVRSMTSKEADHGQATYYLHTGYQPRGPIQYPSLGAHVSKENGSDTATLPNFVSIGPFRGFSPQAFNSGFLGPKYAPLIVGEESYRTNADDNEKSLRVENLVSAEPMSQARFDARVALLEQMQRDFVTQREGGAARGHRTAYERAVKLMTTSAAKAFRLEDESDSVRDAYGRNLFGQGCLLARRLVEQGVPFIEVTLSRLAQNTIAWDSHQNNFPTVKSLSEVLDPAWATLMSDLQERGLLDSTLVVWMTEFGRTPKINNSKGRDHFPNVWSSVLAGAGIKGGQVYGQTSPDGGSVSKDPVSVPNFLATVCRALGIDPKTQNMSNVGRPIRIADPSARPVTQLLA